MKYLFLLLILSSCEYSIEECNNNDHVWDYFDSCAIIQGTRQYEQSRPAPCPWELKDGKCYPPLEEK